MTRAVSYEVIPLASDGYSPNNAPHLLPALFYRSSIGGDGGEGGGGAPPSVSSEEARMWVEERGWTPSWEFEMYKKAHYHSTTHELLYVLRGSASILLGGADERAKPPPPPPPARRAGGRGQEEAEEKEDEAATQRQLDLEPGDILLIPAGYTHRALRSSDDFTMLGSYPRGAANWNMRYPNINGCRYDVDEIASLVDGAPRKALYEAQDPVKGRGENGGEGALQRAWSLSAG